MEIHKFLLPIKNDNDLADFIYYAFGVKIPNTKICENHSTPFEAFSSAYFARAPIAVWKASRGLGGKTFLLSILALTEALTLKADVNLLGGSGEQSKRVLEHMAAFWNYRNAPRALLSGDIQREMRLIWGNKIEALMASQASVRGPHPVRLRLDEVDEMSLAILDSALGQPMSKDGVVSHVVESSTHQYADGTMTECLKRAAENNYSTYEWCYRETLQPHGWLTVEEVERKRRQMTKGDWDNEVELQEPSPESRAIQPDAVKRMFVRDIGVYTGAVYERIIIEKPQPDALYATGIDWAKEVNDTIIVTFRIDVLPARLVAFERTQREDWQVMIAKGARRVKEYPGPMCHDGTGLGDVVDDLIAEHLRGMPNIEGVWLSGMLRQKTLNDYCVAIENNELRAPHIEFMERQHRLASRADLYNTSDKKHHLPDTISAGALAYRAATMDIEQQAVVDHHKAIDSRW